jgi:hypothetical protein
VAGFACERLVAHGRLCIFFLCFLCSESILLFLRDF